MSGTCVDNARLGIIGCGATYGGETQHCVAPAPWSAHPDGRAHMTGRHSTIERCWTKGVLTDPQTIDSLRLDERGVWRQNIDGAPASWSPVAAD